MYRLIKYCDEQFREVKKEEYWAFKVVTSYDNYGNYLSTKVYERREVRQDIYFENPSTPEQFLMNLIYEFKHDLSIWYGLEFTPVKDGIYITFYIPSMDGDMSNSVTDFEPFPEGVKHGSMQ